MPSSHDWRLDPTIAAPATVRRIGQYDLIEPLGRGGMGVVWKAVHRHLGQTVAIKFLASDAWTDPQAVARFYREMRAVGRVAHPNLVRALDAGEYDGHHVLVMECVEGVTARDLVGSVGPLPIAAACEIGRQAALGLSAIAAAGMVHRDIKPSNLILTADGAVKILDLGLARFHADVDDRELTVSGYLLGTVDFMSPEQSADPRTVDARSDIYSLGCTLYAMLTGASPFASQQKSSLEERLRAHREETPEKLEILRPDVPPALSALIEMMLAKSPDDRTMAAAQVSAVMAELADVNALRELMREVANSPTPRDHSTAKKWNDTSRASDLATADYPDPGAAKESKAKALVAPHKTTPHRWPILVTATLGCIVLTALGIAWWTKGPDNDEAPKYSDKVAQELISKSPEVVPTTTESATVRDYSTAPKLEWQDLLAHRPVPVVWQNTEGLARWDWQEKQRQLVVSNNEKGWLSLGTMNAQSFQLQIGMHQNGWPGGIGVFLGMEPADSPRNAGGWRCLQFMIHQVSDSRNFQSNRMDFSRLVCDGGDDRPLTFDATSLSSEMAAGLVGEAILELTIKDGRLRRALFNGVPLGELMESMNENGESLNWSGGFGISVSRGDATIRTARLMILDDKR